MNKPTLTSYASNLAEEVTRLRREIYELQVELRYVAKFKENEYTTKQVLEAIDSALAKIRGEHDE